MTQITSNFVARKSDTEVLDKTVEAIANIETRVKDTLPEMSEQSREQLAKLSSTVPDFFKFSDDNGHVFFNKIQAAVSKALDNDGKDKVMKRLYPLFLDYFKLKHIGDSILEPLTEISKKYRDVLTAISCGISNRDFHKPGAEKSGFHSELYRKLTNDLPPGELKNRHRIEKPGKHYNISTFFSF